MLVCQWILQDHVIKGSCDFKGRSPSSSATIYKSGGHRHSDSGDIMVFICHVTTEDHVIKALFDFMVWSPSR